MIETLSELERRPLVDEFEAKLRRLARISEPSRLIDPYVLNLARQVASKGMSFGLPAPDPVPTAKGGIQVEWHASPISLEIEVLRDGLFDCYGVDRSTGEEFELNGTVNLSRMNEWMRRSARAIGK